LGYILGDFLQTHLVTLAASSLMRFKKQNGFFYFVKTNVLQRQMQ
jgi:hypothetical protein